MGAIGLDEGNFWLIHHHAEAAVRKCLGSQLPAAHAVDLGCGAGRSCLWLRSLGLQEVHGVDTSQEMLRQALQRNPHGVFALSQEGCCPFESGVYDLVLSMVVLPEISTLDHMKQYAAEAYRLLRPGGFIVATSATEESHDPANNFVSFRYLPSNESDPHNRGLHSGDRVVCRNNNGLCLEDYFWSRDDIVSSFQTAGFQEREVTKTFGNSKD